jgi:hypothetical protein
VVESVSSFDRFFFLPFSPPILSDVTEDYEIIFWLDPSPDRTEDLKF